MAFESPFSPSGATVSVSASAGGTVTGPITSFPSYNNSGTIYVVNPGPDLAFVGWGAGGASATLPIPASSFGIFSVAKVDTVAARTASAAATIYFTPGNGGR